jgi:HD-GYP domain-containing protein (c-di-GMP phosphodiesterase class II)
MSSAQEFWEPATAETLAVGDTIRIDHRWVDHPFERRLFRISSDKEIATIRDTGLTRVFVDRSPPAEEIPAEVAPAQPAATDGSTAAEQVPTPDPDAEAAKQAAREAARRSEQREALASAQARDRVTRERAQQTLAMLSAGHQDSAEAVASLVDYLVAILNNSTSALAPMAPAAPRRSPTRLALLGSDAVWLAGTIGKRMGLTRAELRALTHAAATHAVGLTRMPPNLPEEQPGVALRGTPLEKYPLYSAMILEQCGGFPEEVRRIVREHHERPDGTGLPNGLRKEQIHPHALIIGAVRELQIRCADSAVSPAVALATIYKSLRDLYGTTIVNHLAAAVLLIPVGTYVQLSDGSLARVLRINEAARLAPVVESFGQNSAVHAPREIDLSQREDLRIVRALDTSRLPPRMFETVRNTGPDTRPPKPAPADALQAAAAESPGPEAQSPGTADSPSAG